MIFLSKHFSALNGRKFIFYALVFQIPILESQLFLFLFFFPPNEVLKYVRPMNKVSEIFYHNTDKNGSSQEQSLFQGAILFQS